MKSFPPSFPRRSCESPSCQPWSFVSNPCTRYMYGSRVVWVCEVVCCIFEIRIATHTSCELKIGNSFENYHGIHDAPLAQPTITLPPYTYLQFYPLGYVSTLVWWNQVMLTEGYKNRNGHDVCGILILCIQFINSLQN